MKVIGKYLRAGVMLEGVVMRTEMGTPRHKAAPYHHYWPTSIWTHWTKNWSDEDTASADTLTTAIST